VTRLGYRIGEKSVDSLPLSRKRGFPVVLEQASELERKGLGIVEQKLGESQ
jgi:hypothetical protein